MGQLVGAQGQVKVAKKCKNTPTCDVTPSKRQNKKIIFSMSTRRLAESVEGLKKFFLAKNDFTAAFKSLLFPKLFFHDFMVAILYIAPFL